MHVKEILSDCDEDAVLVKVKLEGPTCHTGSYSCFGDKETKGFLYELEKTIDRRIEEDASNSYTNTLYKKGINKVAQKVVMRILDSDLLNDSVCEI